jgi:hypothetical protein
MTMASETEVEQSVAALRANPTDRTAIQTIHRSARQDAELTRRVLHRHGARAAPLRPDLGLPPPGVHVLHNATMPQNFANADPESLPALRDTMARAAADWRSMRGIGSEYSFSNIAFTSGFFIRLPTHLNRILEVERDLLRPIDETLLHFEAGATIDLLNDYLWKNNLSLWNQPGYGRLSYVGAMTAGGHGSGLTFGPLASYARSLRVLTINEKDQVAELQIEPVSGITDPDPWRRKHPDVELIQDDALFQSCLVSAGSLGVIYSLVISVRPSRFYLSETRTKRLWEDVKQELPTLLSTRYHSCAFWLNPYLVEGKSWCVVGTNEYTERTSSPNQRGVGILLGGTQPLLDIIEEIANLFPKAVPGLVDEAITSTQDHDVVMPSPEALNFGPPNNLHVVASASGFDVKDTVAATEAVMRFLRERADKDQVYLTSPLGLRFVKACDAFLAPQYGRDSCMMETPSLYGTTRAQQTIADIHELLATGFQGRPHLGQINRLSGDLMRKNWPRFWEFVDSFAVLNPRGFFDNAFTEQLGLRAAANADPS